MYIFNTFVIPNEIFFEIQVLDNTRKRLDVNQIDY